jgi:predicted GNAT family N-acyltransferase
MLVNAMGIEIRELTSHEDRQRVYRFWYNIYVREMNRVQKYADHEAGTIQEPLDQTGHVLAAIVDGEIIGTIRINYAWDGDISYYADLYEMHRYAPFYPSRACINTKLMTAPRYRNSTLGLRLVKSSFAKGTGDGGRFDFIDCNSHLKPFFERVGYRQLRDDIVHPEYGRVHPMVLVTHDLKHLANVGSPFVSLVTQPVVDHGSVDFFYREIVQSKA